MIILVASSWPSPRLTFASPTKYGKTREVYSKPGETRWYLPFKHMVENLGDTTCDAVYVGIKSGVFVSVSSADPPPAVDEETRKIVAEFLLASVKQ